MSRSLVTAVALVALTATGAGAKCKNSSALKNAYFGEMHNHTSYSLDAYGFGTRTDPAASYAFARGAAVDVATGFDAGAGEVPGPFGVTIEESGGALDFAAVTDHAEWLSTDYGCLIDPTSPIYDSPACVALRAGENVPADERPCRGFADLTATGCLETQTDAWTAEQQATEAADDPCTFTTFHAYEWTFSPGATLHRNVFFKNASVPSVPLDAQNYPTAPVLFAALADQCNASTGCEALTIPHNMNQSGGQAFTIAGYTATDLNRLRKYQRLAEIHQHKASSECLTDTADGGAVSVCAFEVNPTLDQPADAPGYARPALEAGLVRFAERGYDPLTFGFVAATDNHNGTMGRVGESSFTGHVGTRDNQPIPRLTGSRLRLFNPGGLAGAWAEENTRDALWGAYKRRETFATSGPRIKVRFYEATGLANPCADPDFPKQVVEGGGVPMGGLTRDKGAAPTFVVYALQDQTPLAAVDIVKGSATASAADEKVYTIPLGAPPACVTWTDPAFDPAEPAFWYARVREQPTWRWSHYDCEALKQSNPADWQTIAPGCASSDPASGGLDTMIEERAWTSPIWYLPGGPVTVQSTSLKLRDGSLSGGPSKRKFSFKAKTRKDTPDHRIVVPALGSVGDPTVNGMTGGGATLTVYNAESGEQFVTALPASGWKLSGGTRYAFSAQSGPVQKVTVKADSLIVRGGREAWGYTLDEPRQGAVAVRLQLGTATPWCTEAPAKLSGHPPTSAKHDVADKFTAQSKTPPPDQCPILGSPSGAFLD